MHKLDPEEIEHCLSEAEEILSTMDNIIITDSDLPHYIIGDIHGDIESFNRLFRFLTERIDTAKFVFLGDYVDRGGHSTEVICYLIEKFLDYPKNLILLRGNHETMIVNQYYGFYAELLKKYGERGRDLYVKFNEMFSNFPIAALIDGKVLTLHGGIPKTTYDLAEINKLPKGDLNGENPTLMQILWNDPSEDIKDWSPSPRGEGIFLFGSRPFNEFMAKNDLKYLVRAHSFLVDGFKYFFNNKLLSIFSTLEYVGYRVNGRIAKFHDSKISIARIIDL